jgi:GYF domain 2
VGKEGHSVVQLIFHLRRRRVAADRPNSRSRGATRESGFSQEQRWYYLHRSAQVGPYLQSELHSLLVKKVISPTTLVRQEGNGRWRAFRDIPEEAAAGTHKRKQNWAIVALGIAVFLGAIVVLKVPTSSESGNVFGIISRLKNKQELLDVIRESKQIQITETARFDFSRRNDLVEVSDLHIFGPRTYRKLSWIQVEMMMQKVRDDMNAASGGGQEPRNNSSISSTGFVSNSVRPSLTSQASATPPALSPADGQLVQEFWRSITSSHVVDRYEFYLRRYPFGIFADMATAKIKELRKIPKEASVNGSEGGAAKKKKSSNSSKTTKPTSAKTTAAETSTQEASGNGGEGGTAKKKKSNNSSKTTKPSSVKTIAVETSTEKTRGRCRIGNNGRCTSAPLKTTEKDCVVSANNTMPYKPCVIRNYQSKKKS